VTDQVIELFTGRPLDEWADIIRGDLTGAVEGLIAAGRHLLEAKAEHPGTFVAWLDSRPFGISRSAAYNLMTVTAALGDFQTFGNFPPDRSALYELARLRRDQLSAAVEAGRVQPDMNRHDAKALVATYRANGHTNKKQSPLVATTTACYPTVVVDPPWEYDNRATRNAAAKHYPTMTLAQLADYDVTAAANAHLYLWVTNAFLRQAFDLLDAWDFDYKTCLTWCKPQIGLGNYFRNNTEHVFFAVRGKLATLRSDEPTWFKARRGRHSAKPEAFYDLVERCSPGPYLEHFARRRRLGWEHRGNEA
jgi:N6-adenosine-specific RNA methylase IME4